MVTRRSTLSMLGAPFVMRAAPKRPNFVFILADDHAGYVLGADGNRLARTPSLDRFVKENVRFARHYCNSPVCTPSRQCLFTGEMPHSAGVTRLPTPLDASKPTLAKQFKKAGYTTAVFGKMHFNRPGVPGLHGFDTAFTEDVLTREWRAQVKPTPLPEGTRVKPPWKPFRDPARIWLNAGKLPYDRYDAEMRASFQVRQVERYLEQRRNEPFALWVSFLEPHSPYDFPFEYRDRFSPRDFTPPRVGPEDAWQIPLIFRELSDSDKQGIAASYYTSVEFLDRNIGRVLAKLPENTVVVYSADHGYCLGQHGRFEKHCGYDPALRVPLIIHDPRRPRSATVNAMTEHADLSATITDVLGLEPLPVQHGRSLRALLEGESGSGRDHIFSEYLENEEAYIRTDRWKFVYCSGKRARGDGYATANPAPGRYTILHDLQSDSGEFHNVAARHEDVVKELKGLMLARFRSTHPDASAEPKGASIEDSLDFYLRPRDV
jgi:choline-sulfatase